MRSGHFFSLADAYEFGFGVTTTPMMLSFNSQPANQNLDHLRPILPSFLSLFTAPIFFN
jgi:hypothetical protein